MSTIPEIINILKQNWREPAPAVHRGEKTAFTFVCHFSNEGRQVDANYPFKIPEDLKQFWSITNTAELFKDNEFGQWGLRILDPSQTLSVTEDEKQRPGRDFDENDLIIGEFIGDSDLLILSDDNDDGQYDSVRIALPIDKRKDWPVVAAGLTEFLEKYVSYEGDKYWEIY